jgi:hypothetical protein
MDEPDDHLLKKKLRYLFISGFLSLEQFTGCIHFQFNLFQNLFYNLFSILFYRNQNQKKQRSKKIALILVGALTLMYSVSELVVAVYYTGSLALLRCFSNNILFLSSWSHFLILVMDFITWVMSFPLELHIGQWWYWFRNLKFDRILTFTFWLVLVFRWQVKHDMKRCRMVGNELKCWEVSLMAVFYYHFLFMSSWRLFLASSILLVSQRLKYFEFCWTTYTITITITRTHNHTITITITIIITVTITRTHNHTITMIITITLSNHLTFYYFKILRMMTFFWLLLELDSGSTSLELFYLEVYHFSFTIVLSFFLHLLFFLFNWLTIIFVCISTDCFFVSEINSYWDPCTSSHS